MQHAILESPDASVYDITTHAEGPAGSLPLTPEMLMNWASGDIFGMSQNAGMGWNPANLTGKQFLILSTAGGVRGDDGKPIALGYHTGHWEIGLLVRAAAHEFAGRGAIPFAGFCSDPCDGRTQGTNGMMDSLAFRNDSAIVFRRLIRSMPRRDGVMGIATCDKGLPAMMMALAGGGDLPCILVPGGVTLPATHGEDAGKTQTLGARYAAKVISLEEAAELGCRACASPGGGCQFLGTAATSQVVGEAIGLSLPHSALAPSGQRIWLDMAQRSATALMELERRRITVRQIITDDSIRNAMTVHAAFGGSTNLLLHIPAIAHAAGLPRPTVDDWIAINRKVPRIVDVLPNGPTGHVTVRAFLAGGVPEVMLHLRDMDLLHLDCMTACGERLGDVLEWWKTSDRRVRLREELMRRDGVDADDVIMSPAKARSRGLTSTITFPRGNLAPQGSVIKSTAIDPSVVDPDGVYRQTGPARVFLTETAAIQAIKHDQVKPGDVMVVICLGPLGAGMPEIYQITSALKHLDFGKHVTLLTDARFSGVSTGACIGHVGPEALAGGPIGKLRDGDVIQITIDRNNLVGSIDFVGEPGGPRLTPEQGEHILAQRPPRPDLASNPNLPDDTRLWAALQDVAGGIWGGCVYDTDQIIAKLRA
jgi:putative YjhG/YagF family dehydratase